MQSPPKSPELRKGREIPIEPKDDGEVRYAPDPDNGMKKKSSIAIPAIVGVVALLAIGLFLKSRGAKKAAAPDAAAAGPRLTTVRVIPATTGTIVETLPLTGQLKSNQDVNLNSKITGQVARVYVDEGQRVSRGQLLVALDTGDLQQQVQSARAGLESAQVKLDQARVGLPARVAQINNAVREAQTQVGSAQARLQQAQTSQPTTATNARSQVESAKAAIGSNQARVKQARDTAKQVQGQVNAGIASAQAALGQARAQLQQVKNGSRDQQVAQAQAQVNVAQAQLDDAQTNLTRQQTLFQGGATAKANVDTAETTVKVARANLEAARQSLSLVREGSRTEEVRQAEQIVAQREAALNTARADLSRVPASQAQISDALGGLAQSQESLRQANANLSSIPNGQQDVVQAQQAVNQAKTQLQTAQSNRAQIPVARADVPAAQTQVDAARSQLQQAQLNLGYAQIKAPVSGVVNTKSIDEGETVSPGATLLNIVSTSNVIFEAQVPASQLGQIEVGQPAKIIISAQNNKPVTGYVTEVIPVADARLRQFRVRISLEAQDGLTPGAFAQGILQTQVSRGALTVPTEDVRVGDGNPYIYVAVADGDNFIAKKREVKVGAAANGKTQILSGLQVGDKVIEGNALYDDGQKIKVAKENQ